ncbi:reverse transcriptase domain-containing protein [Aestuariivita sp.]|jgi:hypothetical protein|uniref:reverse transcriptase domain-containing protein n=1 Tax=Aestuariivita sp. TaxID=1872407 RepID=UPI002171F36E|nr:reverse transcriptase domain-containing protein [Aestuariivita sp.]MCE8006166.1 hypothetical protein [Aestuariivita sp.]
MLDAPAPIDALFVLQNEKAWRRALHRDQVRYNKNLGQLHKAIAEGDLAKVAEYQDWLLTSPSAKRVAIAQLLQAGKDVNVWTYGDVKALAETVTVHEAMDEPVRLFTKEKTSKTGYRTIFSFGDRHRVAQRLLANVIQAHTTKQRFQLFDAGVPKAITRALSLIKAGNVWLAHLDIKDFYPSFTIKGLSTFVPLPQTVVEAALTGRNMVLECALLPEGLSPLYLIEEARRGLPQGASSSPAISHLCVSQLVLDVATLEHLFNYADDFLLVATTQAELEHRIAALMDAVGNLPGGQFELSFKCATHVSEGVDFLGHHLVMRDGVPVAEPTEANMMRLFKRLHEIDERFGVYNHTGEQVCPDAVLQSCADKFALYEGWRAAFQACDPNTEAWASIELVPTQIVESISGMGLEGEIPLPQSSPTAQQGRKFYYYKWFG